MTTNKSHLTAIARKTLPLPTRWLMKHYLPTRYIQYEHGKETITNILDFGCGWCHPLNPIWWYNYDPHYMPMTLSAYKGFFDVIVCNYVLCTLPHGEHKKVLKQIQSLLKSKTGVAYITVRNDKPKQGWGISKRGTYQGRGTGLIKLPLLYKNSQFRIYRLTKKDKLV